MISERIRIALDAAQMSQAALARACNVKPASVHGWLNGKAKFLRGENLLSAAKALGVSDIWLASGRGPMITEPSPVSIQEPTPRYLLENAHEVPIVEWLSITSYLADASGATPKILCPCPHSPKTFAARITGESMANPAGKPTFHEGDLIYIDRDQPPAHKSLVLVQDLQDKSIAFRRLLIDGSQQFLELLNPSWPHRILQLTAYNKICGVVIAKLETYL